VRGGRMHPRRRPRGPSAGGRILSHPRATASLPRRVGPPFPVSGRLPRGLAPARRPPGDPPILTGAASPPKALGAPIKSFRPLALFSAAAHAA
jgi:hypothetical protein